MALTQSEIIELYPDTMTDTKYVTAIYANLFG